MIKHLLGKWLGFQEQIDYLLQRIRVLYGQRDRLLDRIALLEAELRVARGEPDGSHDIEDPIEAAWPTIAPFLDESTRWLNG